MSGDTERDAALALLAATRAQLIEDAREIAIALALAQGTVTSPQVLAVMQCHPEIARDLMCVDKRFMGVVFRDIDVWERLRFVPEGSHSQPISLWRLRRVTQLDHP